MIDRLLIGAVGFCAVAASVLAAVWTFASSTENVSLIGGGGILVGSIGLLTFVIRLWAKEAARQRGVAVAEGNRADRAEYQRGILRDLCDMNGIAVPGNYYIWPIAPLGKE